MILDIQQIVNQKLAEMAENKTIETQIQKTLEKSVNEAVTDALSDYTFTKNIKDKLRDTVGKSLDGFDFSSYHGFITDYFNQLVNHHLKEDIKAKIEQSFNQILFVKRDSIKLSEIYDAYRDFLLEHLRESEKYDLNNYFYHEISRDKYTIKIKLGRSEFDRTSCYDQNDSILFEIWPERESIGTDEERGTLWLVDCHGYKIDKELIFKDLSSFELLMINLYFNKTQIEIDVWDDIDTSLGLDI